MPLFCPTKRQSWACIEILEGGYDSVLAGVKMAISPLYHTCGVYSAGLMTYEILEILLQIRAILNVPILLM